MALVIKRPWSQSFNGPFNHSSTSGTVDDVQRDEVSQRNKTKRATWRPPTPYTRYVREGYCDAVEFSGSLTTRDYFGKTVRLRSGACNFSGYYSSEPPTFPQELVDRAVGKCLDKLKNSHVNLGQAFAERKQTDQLIGDNAIKCAELLNNHRTDELEKLYRTLKYAKSLRRIREILKAISRLRLEIAYGWIPLMQDSFGLVQHLSEREKEANRATITVKSRQKMSYTDRYTVGADIGGIHWQIDRFREIQHEVLVRLDYYKDNGLLHELSQLGITNPVSLVWEVTRLSFVVDWFVSIGDYLSRLDATLGMSFHGGSASKKTTVKVRPLNRGFEPGYGAGVEGFMTPSGRGRMMLFNRNVYGESPMIPPPSFKTGGSLSHVYNGAALLAQAISKSGFLD